MKNESSESHEAEEYVGLADFVAEGDEQVFKINTDFTE